LATGTDDRSDAEILLGHGGKFLEAGGLVVGYADVGEGRLGCRVTRRPRITQRLGITPPRRPLPIPRRLLQHLPALPFGGDPSQGGLLLRPRERLSVTRAAGGGHAILRHGICRRV